MGVINTLGAVGNATRTFLESGYCDILISALYLYLAWYAVHMSRCRVWPWSHRLRAVFFLSQFAFFSLRICSSSNVFLRERVREAARVLWAFNHIDTMAACLLWKTWMTRMTEITFKRAPLFPNFVLLIPVVELSACPLLAMFSHRGLDIYLASISWQPLVCQLNMLFFYCLMGLKHYQSSAEEKQKMKQEYEQSSNKLELQYSLSISLAIFQARVLRQGSAVSDFSAYLQEWYVPPKAALFDMLMGFAWALTAKEYIQKKEAQEKQEVAASLGIDEKRQDGQLESV